jgi:conjugal transfer pilin signal peptidase TrbI
MAELTRGVKPHTFHKRTRRWSSTRNIFYWMVWVLPAIIGWCSFLIWFDTRYAIALNRSSSLTGSIYLIKRDGVVPPKGEFVAVRPGITPVYQWDVMYVKILGGVPGDKVEEKNREYFVNGEKRAKAKRESRLGLPLQLGPIGVIPEGQYFIYTPSPDGYDSRYHDIGWLPAESVVGAAYVLL